MMATMGHTNIFTFKFNFNGGNSGLCHQKLRMKIMVWPIVAIFKIAINKQRKVI